MRRQGRLMPRRRRGRPFPGHASRFHRRRLGKSGEPGGFGVDQRKKLSRRRDLRRQTMQNQPLRIDAQGRQVRITHQGKFLSQRRHRRVLPPEGRGDASSATPSTG